MPAVRQCVPRWVMLALPTAATIGSYNAIVKVADATGVELDESTAEMTVDMRADLDLVDHKI
jgi:hypothetical protein